MTKHRSEVRRYCKKRKGFMRKKQTNGVGLEETVADISSNLVHEGDTLIPGPSRDQEQQIISAPQLLKNPSPQKNRSYIYYLQKTCK